MVYVLAAKTELKNAEKVKLLLLKKNLLDTNYKAKKEGNYVYFPTKKKFQTKLTKFVDTNLEAKQEQPTLEKLLKNKLTKNQLAKIPQTQEIVGDIMILEIPEELQSKEKLIAEIYLKINKHIKTVVKKHEIHSGVFRTRKLKVLAGKRTKTTIHLESGVRIKLNLEKSYFSARLGNERLRIVKQVKKDENILVMFSGSAPYPLVIAKHCDTKEILGIEINPDAHKFGLENIKLNKMEKQIKLINGDVRKILPKVKKQFDRVLMPLPKTGEDFLDLALPKTKRSGIIHLYAFLNEKDIDSEAKKVKEICKELNYKVRVLRKVKCGQHAPYTYRVCFDLKVLT